MTNLHRRSVPSGVFHPVARDRFRTRFRTVRRLAATLAVTLAPCLALTPAAALAGSTVERGDVLNVEIMGAPDLSRQAKIGADGRIMLPVLGGIPAAGQDLDTIRATITAALAERDLMHAPAVLVEVASYRPVYIGGAVAQPGALDYTPGLTVRQAIVSVGGLRAPESDSRMTAESVVGIVAENRTAAFALAQINARIARIEAELADSGEIAAPPETVPEVPSAAQAEVLRLETELLGDRRDRASAADSHHQSLIALLDLELEVLQNQATLQGDEVNVLGEEVDNARALVDRGLMARPAYQELLREKSQIGRDVLTNQAMAARARQEKETTRFEMGDQRTELRISLLRDLQDARREQAAADSNLKALRAQLLAAGVQLTDEGRVASPAPAITIHRTEAGTVQTVTSDLDAPVEPGDVIEVLLEQAVVEGG